MSIRLEIRYKVIALGNRLMKDDKIGILVCEKLKNSIENMGYDLIIGETDIDYIISSIKEGDFILIIDGMDENKEVGRVEIFSLDRANENNFFYSQHSISLINIINSIYKDISGYIIGIQIEDIKYDLGISSRLNRKIPIICKEVEAILRKFIIIKS